MRIKQNKMNEIPEGLERFINPYGENPKEFEDRYGVFFNTTITEGNDGKSSYVI